MLRIKEQNNTPNPSGTWWWWWWWWWWIVSAFGRQLLIYWRIGFGWPIKFSPHTYGLIIWWRLALKHLCVRWDYIVPRTSAPYFSPNNRTLNFIFTHRKITINLILKCVKLYPRRLIQDGVLWWTVVQTALKVVVGQKMENVLTARVVNLKSEMYRQAVTFTEKFNNTIFTSIILTIALIKFVAILRSNRNHESWQVLRM